MQRFLEDTSILPVLEPELCDAVTQRPGAARTLRRFVAGNLFTEELAADESAFRYPRCSGNCSRFAWIAATPIDAAHWLADRGRVREATDLLVAAGGRQEAIERLIRRACGPALEQRHAATAVRWLRALLVHRLEEAPDLALVMCRAGGITGDLVTARAVLSAASRQIRSSGGPDPGLLLGEQHLRTGLAVWEGSLDGLAESLGQQLPRLEAQSPTLSLLGLTKASVVSTIAAAHLFRGDLAPLLARPRRPSRRANSHRPPGTSCSPSGLVRSRLHGRGTRHAPPSRPRRQPRWLQLSRQLRPSRSSRGRPLLGVGPPDQAESAYGHARVAAATTAIPLLRALPSLLTVRVFTRLGRVDQARAAFAVARRVVSELPEPGYVTEILADLDHTLKLQEVSRPDLTPLELQMVRQIATGSSRAEVADALHYSVNTVRYHLKSAYRKLGVVNRRDAVSAAREWGLLDAVAAPPPPRTGPGAPDLVGQADGH